MNAVEFSPHEHNVFFRQQYISQVVLYRTSANGNFTVAKRERTFRRPGKTAEKAVELLILKQVETLRFAVALTLSRRACASTAYAAVSSNSASDPNGLPLAKLLVEAACISSVQKVPYRLIDTLTLTCLNVSPEAGIVRLESTCRH